MGLIRAIRKLRKMPLGEIRGRIAEWQRCGAERKTYRRRQRLAARSAVTADNTRQLAARAAAMVPGADAGELAALRCSHRELHDALRDRAVRRAEAILAGTCTLLGRNVDLSTIVDWHQDPGSQHRWRRDFYADLNLYESPNGLDVKHVWELNRHQFLVELSRSWLLARNSQHAARVRELLLDWIEENPQYEGVNWTSSLEVAVRSISWLWTLAATAEWPGWKDSDWMQITRSLSEHAGYLEGHLSLYSSPYNHLIAEATGLFLLGRWLRGCDGAGRWSGRGRDILCRFGPKQFHADGFCVEQATGYHFFTLGFLVQAVVTARAAGEPLGELEPVVANAFKAAAAMKQPDQRWPAVGDSDSARSIPVYPDDYWDFRSLCSLGAVLCGLAELKETAQRAGEELYWLLGTGGLQAWDNLPVGHKVCASVLPQSGYVAAASGNDEEADWLLFDAGPLADGLHHDATPSVAHGHADALQLLLFQQGRPLLVDSGIESYGGQRRWVDHFRGVSAHNTLEVEGAPWVRTAGRLAWSHVRAVPRLDANISPHAWLMRGRLSPAGGVTVERNILGLAGCGIWIADLIRCETPRQVRWYWQMPRSAHPRLDRHDDSQCEIRLNTGVLATWTDAEGMEIGIESASSGNPAARQAPMYGSSTEGFRVSGRAACAGELLTVTFLGAEAISASVELRGRKLACSPAGHPNLSPTANDLEANVIWHVETREGQQTFAAGVSACRSEDNWLPLGGNGNWPAVKADLPVMRSLKRC